MANRFWVGGTGTWDASSTTHWASSSGGSSGASVPTSADDVTFDSSSNATAYTVTIGASVQCNNININAPAAGNLSFAGSSSITISGNFTQGINISHLGSQPLSFNGSGSKTITQGGFGWLGNVNFNGSTSTWTLQDTFDIGSGTITLTQGTLDTNGKAVNAGAFSSNNSNTRSLVLGASTMTLSGSSTVWNAITSTGMTLSAGSSVIKFTQTGAFTFAGGGLTYNNVWFAHGSGTGTITFLDGSTFNDFKDDGTGTHIISFAAGTTQTVTTFSVSGTAGHLISLASSTTATYTLSAASGIVSCDYLNIQHCIATGGASWFAGSNSVNNQAVVTAGSGWVFTPPSTTYTLTTIVGVFTLTGIAVGLSHGTGISPTVGVFNLTGIAANFTSTRTMSAVVGAYTLTGIDVVLSHGTPHIFPVTVGSFVLTGNDAQMHPTPHMFAGTGSFVLTGIPANLNFSGWTNGHRSSSVWTDGTRSSTTFATQGANQSDWVNQAKL